MVVVNIGANSVGVSGFEQPRRKLCGC